MKVIEALLLVAAAFLFALWVGAMLGCAAIAAGAIGTVIGNIGADAIEGKLDKNGKAK